MSLCADKEPSTMNETTNSSNSVSAMWARFHELENQYVAYTVSKLVYNIYSV